MTDHADLTVDLAIIGAGPVGLYGGYYAGFRGLSVAVVDALPQVGGQVAALYPEKAIYDIAGFPAVRGQDLVDGLARQAAPFDPHYVLGTEAQRLEPAERGWQVTTSDGRRIRAGAVIITGGVGAVSPRPLPCGEEFLGRGLEYFVPRLSAFDGKDVVVIGGGDSAVDWALAAGERAASVTLVHRRRAFRAHAHSVRQLEASDCRLMYDSQVTAVHGEDAVEAVIVHAAGAEPVRLPAQLVVAALGFVMQLGPIEDWGLDIDLRSIRVGTNMATNLPGVYAAGDITTYPGKVKLIAVGFGEVATAVNNAAAYLDPSAAVFPGHSTDAAPAPVVRPAAEVLSA
jgi:thioredoxin reductase